MLKTQTMFKVSDGVIKMFKMFNEVNNAGNAISASKWQVPTELLQRAPLCINKGEILNSTN